MNIHRPIRLSAAALSVILSVQSSFAAETNYYTDINEGSSPGTNWGSATWWATNTAGTNGTLAPTNGGLYYTAYNGTQAASATGCTQLRNPYTSGTPSPIVFTGDSLILSTNTRISGKNSGLYFLTQVYGGNTNGTTLTNGNGNANPNAIFRIDDPYLNFPGANGYPGLVLNGGNLVASTGSGYGSVYTGTMQAAPSSISYLWPGGTILGATDVRGFVLNAALSGSGTIAICNGTNGEPCVQVYSTANTNFTGTWLLQSGWLQAVGDGTQDGYNSLGTNANCSIIVDPNFVPPLGSGSNFFSATAAVTNLTNSALLDLGSNLMNSAGSLTISNNGQMWMHGNYIFSHVLITNIFKNTGSNLAAGTYAYTNLTNMFPSNFTKLPSVLTTFGGTLTVQPFGNLPPILAPAVAPQPVSQAAFSGDPVEFVSGSYYTYPGAQNPTFQWYTVDGTHTIFTPVNNGGQISGATNGTLVITNVSAANETNFALVLSNIYGMATSAIVALTNVFLAPTAITLDYANESTGNGINGSLTMSGDWNTVGYWWDGNVDGGLSASTLAYDLPGVPFILVTGSELRTPSGAAATNFPGAMLELTGTGSFALGEAAVANLNSVMISKAGPAVNSGSFGELYFTNLYISGGQIDSGNNGFTIFDGAMTIGTNNALFYTDNSGTEDRGYQVNSTLSGSGTIQLYLYSAASVFETSYSNDLNITAANNPFTGAWLVTQGSLLGSGSMSLGTNTPITIDANGAFETMYDVNDPNGTLTLNGRMYLHQNDTFSNVLVGGILLPSGTFSYVTLANSFGPAYFPPGWTQLNGSTSNMASGSITVVGTNGNGAPTVATPASQIGFLGYPSQIAGVVAGSPPLTYQWYTVDSSDTIFTPLVNGPGVSGATNSTLSLSSLAMDEATNYVLVVTNLGGATTSAPPTVLTIYPAPASITLNYAGSGSGSQQMAFGSDWNTTGYWWDGQQDGGLPAATLAPLLPGVPFVVPPGSTIRTPSTGFPTTATFPGGELDLDGDGNFNNGNTGYTTTSSMNLKGGTGAVGAAYEIRFTNLVINGGQIDLGVDAVGTLDGAISIGISNAYIFMDTSDTTPDDRGLQINSVLSGPGAIQINLYSYTNIFETAHTNDLDIAGINNPFSGTWNVVQGVLLGGGSNSLGTNSILVGLNGALETLYNVNNSNGNLTLNGRMFLHQNDTFSNVTVGGLPLPAGTYSYSQLAGYGASYFPASWPQKYGSTISNASGSITVLGTNGNLFIVTQPPSKILYAGLPAYFPVVASGQPTISYQWASGVTGSGGPYTSIPGATNVTLTVPAITTSDDLDYVVILSNSQGSLTSSPATLTVIADPTASSYATSVIDLTTSNLVAYWRFNETSGTIAYDYAGGFNGIYEPNVLYGAENILGPQPPAFEGFEAGTNYALGTEYFEPQSYAQVPALNVNTNSLTIIAWINPNNTQPNGAAVFFCRAGTTDAGLSYTANTVNSLNTLGYTWNGADYTWNSKLVPPIGEWSMVALAISPTNTTLYLVNASGLQSSNNPGANTVQNFDGFSQIGNDSGSATGSRTFSGTIDEVSVFNTTLSASQINSLYGQAVQVPTIMTQPSSVSEIAGETATFTVVAQGATPLSYQWAAAPTGSGGPYTSLSNGGQISGATNATLTIQNVNTANALDYVVVITNIFSTQPFTTSQPATLTVYSAPATITLNYATGGSGGQIMAGGADWNSTGYWWDGVADGGQPASALAPIGVPFVVPAGSDLRTPNGATATNFPGAELDLDGDGTFLNTYPPATSFPCGILVYKGGANTSAANFGEVYFTNLVINGGQIDGGNAGVVVFEGAINVGSNGAYFYVDTTEGATGGDRGFQINSVLSGSGLIQLYLYSGATGFVTAYSNNLNIAAANNSFNGPWIVSQGPLLGSGVNSLGPNSITVGTNGALETLYDINDPNATLTLDGLMFLHQNDTFQYVTVNGANLYAGTYTAAQLTAALPASFPASWTQLAGSTVSNASGTLTVLQPPATAPTMSLTVNPLTLTWSQGTLFTATNLLGPWVSLTNASPYTVPTTNGEMFFKVGYSLLP